MNTEIKCHSMNSTIVLGKFIAVKEEDIGLKNPDLRNQYLKLTSKILIKFAPI